jgi:hypothetical protein
MFKVIQSSPRWIIFSPPFFATSSE